MLINARNPAELRVALTSDKTLDDLKIDVAERGLTRGNIYFGTISNIQPSLNAAFIDYGAERNGFLTIQDVVPDAYYKPAKKGQRPRIEEVLEEGQPIVVQITREPEGQKGAALTTNLSLAGRYLVLTPFDKTRGVSRKVDNDDDRRKLKKMASSFEVPDKGGVILRTNALDQNKTTLNRDLNALARLWKRISTEARRSKKVRLLYSDQDIVLQALRDYLDSDVAEVLVDEESAYAKAQEYIRAFMPRSRVKLIFYEDRAPLFARYDLEAQIDRIYQRSAPLPSGGSIVIDRTEALTAIDVNSGRSTKAGSQEETALHTNLEAGREVARQLRLRDIGGLVVVDFIDMRARKNQRQVEKTLIDALKPDKARSTVGRTSSNGLVEINRQRIQQAIQMRTQRICPACSGTGRVPSPEIMSLHILREVQARCSDGSIERVRISLHPELADSLQNHERQQLAEIEQEFDVRIEVISSLKLGRGEKEIDWFARAMLRRGAIVRKAADSAAQLSDAAEDARTARKRSRKKPSRKRKVSARQGDEETKTPEGETEAAADTEDSSERKPRRSRRSSSRKRSSSTKKSASAAKEQTSEASDASDDGAGEERPTARRPRRRRRGSRGRGRSAAAANGDSEAGPKSDSSEEDAPRTRRTRTRTSGESGEGSENGERQRRRPRRRRRTRTTTASSKSDGGAGESAGETNSKPPASADSAPADAAPADSASPEPSAKPRSWARARPPKEAPEAPATDE